MRRAERGQALIEALAAVPACLAAATVLVESGLVVRDRIATTHAATRAAAAAVVGADPRTAAEGALPGGLRRSLEVDVRGNEIVVRSRSSVRLLAAVGHIEHVSRAAIETEDVR